MDGRAEPNYRLIAVVGCVVLAVLVSGTPAQAAPAAPTPPAELKVVCAGKETGLLRYVAARSSCRSTERAISLPADGPVKLCTRTGSFVRRASAAGRCLSGESAFRVPGERPTFYCVLPAPRYLRKEPAAGRCAAKETAVAVSVPVAGGDAYAVNEDGTLNPKAPGVLGDDTDAHGDELTAVLVAGPAHEASFALRADGSFTYRPTKNYHGPDKFTYRASDGRYRSKVATVAITVRPVNDPPSFAKGPDQSVAQDSGPLAVDNWATAISKGGPSNEASQTLTFTLTPANPALFSAGPALSAAGRLTFTPAAGKSGTTTVSVVLKDDGGTANGGDDTSATQTFKVTVVSSNGAPVANADAFAYTEDGAGTLTPNDVLANDSDPDGDTLGATLVDGPDHASVFTLDPNGTFEYTPAANFCGTDSFSYRAGDGTASSAPATVTLTVACVNDAPSFTKGPDVTVDQDSGPQTVDPWASAVRAGPADEAGQALAFTVTANSNPALFAAGPAVSPAGVLTFTPADGAEGAAEVSLVLADDGGTADGGADTSAPQTFTVTLAHVNARPAAAADSYGTTEDGPPLTAPAPGVLGNDTDADGEALSAVLGAGPAHGGLTLNADGSFTYTPDANWCGADSFTYTASDGTDSSASATVALTVTCVSDPPVVTTDPGTLAYTENDPATAVSPGLTVTDVDSAMLTNATVTISANAAAGDELGFTPDHGITGSFAGSTLTLSGSASPGMYQAVLRSVTFRNTSEAPAGPTRTVTFTVTDAQGADGGAARGVGVTAVNDAPVAQDDAGGTDEVTPLTVVAPGVLGNDTDVDGGTLAVTELNGAAQLTGTSAKGATVAILASGAWTYDPAGRFTALETGETATDTFTYTVSDGAGGQDTATVTVTVNGTSGVPTAVADSFDVIGNTGLFVGTARPAGDAGREVSGSLLANDTDPDTATADLVVEPVTDAPTALGGTITVEADGNFTYHPDDGDTGVTDTFTYRVCDSSPCNSGTDANATGTLSLPIAGQVWYVRNDQAAGGDGTSDTPFDTLAEAEAASGTGDTVYVFDGDGTTADLDTGYVMEPDERLIGETRPLDVDPDGPGGNPTIPLFGGTAAAVPTLTASNSDVVSLAPGVTLDGFTLDPSGTGGGIAGGPGAGSGAAGNVTVARVAVTDTGTAGTQPGIELDDTTGTNRFSDVTVTNGGSATAIGVRLDNAGTVIFDAAGTTTIATAGAKALDAAGTNMGTSTWDAITVTGSGTGAIRLNTNTGQTVLGDGAGTDLSLQTASGSAPALDVSGGGAVQVGGAGTDTISATGGPAADIRNTNSSAFDFDSVSSTNSTGDGINLDTNLTTPFTAAAGAISGAAGIAVDVNGGGAGGGTVSYAGAINDGAGATAEITGRDGGAVTLSGTIADGADAGGGITVSGNSGGSVTFSGAPKVINTGSADAVLMSGNAAGTSLQFTGGGLDIDATSGRGLEASGNGGTIEVSGAGNSIQTTTGRALTVTDTLISTNDLTFERIAANGAANGIVLNNTGGAGRGLTVSGTGGACATTGDACTGGVIQSTTGDAVSLATAQDVVLNRMKIVNNLGNGIRGATVTNLGLRDSVVDNNGNDAATDEAGVHLTNLAGNADITRTLVAGSPEDNARIVNSSGTLAQLDVTDSTFRDTDTVSPGNNGLLIQADGGSITADVLGNTFLRNRANGLQVITNGTGSMNVEVDDSGTTQSTFDDNNIGVNIAHNSSGTFAFAVRDLTVDGLDVAAGTGGSASPINVNLAGSATTPMVGRITGNTLTNSDSTTGPGIRMIANGVATLTALVDGNTISQVGNRGIETIARDGSNRVNATITGNSVTLANALAADAIRVDAGAVSTDTTTVCADIRGNTATTTAVGLFGIRVRQRFAGTSFVLEDYAGGPTDDAAVQSFLSTNNNGATSSADHAGAGFTSTADCPMPP